MFRLKVKAVVVLASLVEIDHPVWRFGFFLSGFGGEVRIGKWLCPARMVKE